MLLIVLAVTMVTNFCCLFFVCLFVFLFFVFFFLFVFVLFCFIYYFIIFYFIFIFFLFAFLFLILIIPYFKMAPMSGNVYAIPAKERSKCAKKDVKRSKKPRAE